MPKTAIPKPDLYRKSPSGKTVPGWVGENAARMVELHEGYQLTPGERRVLEVEGYVPQVYLDTKGIPTRGVGQTGEYMRKPFRESYQDHVEKARGMTHGFDLLPDYLQNEIVQSVYRGDWGMSKNTRDLLEAGLVREAAKEFLDHAEYKDANTPQQIKDRIRSVSDALLRYADEIDHMWEEAP